MRVKNYLSKVHSLVATAIQNLVYIYISIKNATNTKEFRCRKKTPFIRPHRLAIRIAERLIEIGDE